MYRSLYGDFELHFALAYTPVLIFILLAGFLVPALWRLFRPCRPSELTVEWFESFSPSCYEAMRGLLAPDDFEFLSSQPGFDPSLFRKLHQDRLCIFRGYLNRLVADFNRLHTLAQLAVALSPDDHSELFAQLLSLRFRFWLSILRVEFSYLLYRFGASNISVGSPIQILADMSRHLASLPLAESLLAR